MSHVSTPVGRPPDWIAKRSAQLSPVFDLEDDYSHDLDEIVDRAHRLRDEEFGL